MVACDPLLSWLPEQRWFAGKDWPIDGVRVAGRSLLRDGDPGLEHAVVAVEQGGHEDYYQLLTGLRGAPPRHLDTEVFAECGGIRRYDALLDPELAALLPEVFSGQASCPVFLPEPGVTLQEGLRAHLLTGEQTNSSVVLGREYILKVFRRPHFGPNRDLDLNRALHAAGCPHISEPLGAVLGNVEDGEMVFGMLQRYLPDAVDGWLMATTSVRDLMVEADLHAQEVGGDFAAESRRLGNAVAAVHRDLAAMLGTRDEGHAGIEHAVTGMHTRLDTVLRAVPTLARHERALRGVFDAAARETGSGYVVQHVHGDLHLGQTLRATSGWVLIDFEGEPAACLAERHAQRSTLADVAGMLRSFDYAAHQHLVGQPEDHQHAVRAREWTERNIEAFCEGYAALTRDPRTEHTLLRAFEMDKAVYEVGYENANRPDWLSIPLGAIERMVGDAGRR